jgi:hypothetical protein
MRTKTMLLSALLGALGSVSVMAQTNVYSLNIVGYINVSIPPGYSILTCPLVCSPDNTLNTLLPNTNEEFGLPGFHTQVSQFTGGQYVAGETAVAPAASPNGSGWLNGGSDVTINPGQAVFIYNPFTSNLPATFVGAVAPVTSQTNTLIPGYNLIGSIVPAQGDLITNSIMNLQSNYPYGKQDIVYLYDPVNGYTDYEYFPAFGGWGVNGSTSTLLDPATTNVVQGFFYFNNQGVTNNWVENFAP